MDDEKPGRVIPVGLRFSSDDGDPSPFGSHPTPVTGLDLHPDVNDPLPLSSHSRPGRADLHRTQLTAGPWNLAGARARPGRGSVENAAAATAGVSREHPAFARSLAVAAAVVSSLPRPGLSLEG